MSTDDASPHRLRILLVAEHFWPEVGGAQVMLRRLAGAWSELGHAVTVLTFRWDRRVPPTESVDGLSIIRLSACPLWLVGTLWRIGQVGAWIRRHAADFDLVYASMLKHVAYAAVGASRPLGLPVVLRTEGGGPTGDVAWLRSARLGGVISRRLRQANAVVAISGPIYHELQRAGFADRQLLYLPNGVPIPKDAWTIGETSKYRTQLGLPERRTVVYTGRISPEKGLETVVEAMATLPEVQLVAVGDGPERARLERLAGRNVIFPGAVSAVEPYLRAADVFILPSFQEGLSISLLEALALGMPVLASDIPANRDLLERELLPLVSPGDVWAWQFALAQLLGDPGAHDSGLVARRRERTTKLYSLKRCAIKHLQLFETLLPEDRP